MYSKKSIENTYLSFFMESEAGKEWYDKNKIVRKISSESPDFIFEMTHEKTIGLERYPNCLSKMKPR
jgi:hypothetical protein